MIQTFTAATIDSLTARMGARRLMRPHSMVQRIYPMVVAPVSMSSTGVLTPFPPLCARSRTRDDVRANQRRRYQTAGIDRVDVNGTTQTHGHTEFLRYDLQAETYTCFTHRA